MTKFGQWCYHGVVQADFLQHNLFRKGLDAFLRGDPHLARLEGLPHFHRSRLEEDIPVMVPGIYILTGSRQVGKTTLIKLIIRRLCERNAIDPHQIYYLPCDTIADFKQLLFEIADFSASVDAARPFALFLDEITYVKEWERAIKALADAGMFDRGSAVITGSDSLILKEAMMAFPGRRGRADVHDFHLHPLSFQEYVALKDGPLAARFDGCRALFRDEFAVSIPPLDGPSGDLLQGLFREYLLVGGFMPAINDFAAEGRIAPSTYRTYVQWVVGDILRRGKQEAYLKEIIAALIPRLAKQITWHNLSAVMSIEHHRTVADYVDMLGRMDAVAVIGALMEDKLKAAPKKARKVCFSDPLIFHALRGWAEGAGDSFDLASALLNAPGDLHNSLIEGSLSALFHRTWRTFYIKAQGEVDIALVKGREMLPIEVKNSVSLDGKELRQILKYRRGIVAYAGWKAGKFKQLDVMPIPCAAMLA